MFKSRDEKVAAYEMLLKQQAALLEGETNLIANLANSSALLNQTLPETVFAGYYLYQDNELVLGPFQAMSHVCILQWAKASAVKLLLNKRL